MKKIKVIDTLNGQVTLYDDETYVLKKRYKHYRTLINSKEDLYYDLVDAGFIVRSVDIEIDVSNNRIYFIMNIKMTFYK